jgi:hypothetical protein
LVRGGAVSTTHLVWSGWEANLQTTKKGHTTMKKCILTWLCFTAITLNGLAYTITFPDVNAHFIANQLNNGNNTLVDVFGTQLPDLTEIIFWQCCDVNPTNTQESANCYHVYIYDSAQPEWGQSWYESDGATPVDPNTIFLAPGQGAIIVPGSPFTLTFSGTPNVPVLPAALPCDCGHWNLLSRQTNDIGTYDNVIGRAPVDGAQVLRWNNIMQAFTVYTFSSGAWTPSLPTLAVGESAFFFVPCTTNCVPTPSGLSAWWPFDEVSGPTANDIAGTVNNIGTYQGSLTPVAGMVGNALCFGDWHDSLFVTNHPEIDFTGSCTNGANSAESFTIDAWIRASASGYAQQNLAGKWSGTGNDWRGYELVLIDGKLSLMIGTGASGSQLYTATMPDLRDDQWHFVAVTLARCATNGNRGTFYLDGSEVSTFVDPQTGDMSNPADLVIGGWYLGCLDELEIFKRTLATQEIQDIFNAGSAGKCKTNSISGVKFNDLNRDGIWETNEPVLTNWTINVYDQTASLVGSTVTDTNGQYHFNLQCGTYTLTENLKPGWKQTCPSNGCYIVTVGSGSGQNTNLNFGNCTNCLQINCVTNIVICSTSNVVLTNCPVTAVDICSNGISVPVQSDPPFPHTFAPGTVTTVHCVATSGEGDSASCEFTVTVVPEERQPLLLYNTGVNDSGGLLPLGAADSHYDLFVNPEGTGRQPFVVRTDHPPFGSWLDNNATSQWIGPRTNDVAASGIYKYRLTFNLTCTNAILEGKWAVDNGGAIVLNENPSPVVTLPSDNFPAFGLWHPFTIASGFVPGQNTLDFYVTNFNSGDGRQTYTGLRVELSGTECCCSNVETFSGVKFFDFNTNGIWETYEYVLPGWTIYAVAEATGETVANVQTDTNGDYHLTLPCGTYFIREVLQSGYTQTCPSNGYYVVTVGSSPNTGLNFGNYMERSGLSICNGVPRVISWPTSSVNWSVWETTNLNNGNWLALTNPPFNICNGCYNVSVPIGLHDAQFFRLATTNPGVLHRP